MADADLICNGWNNCYTTSRWHDWGRWVFVGFMIIGFILFISMLLLISARRRHRSGLKPIVGTAWLAPKNSYPTHHAMPGPPGPAGYYPPPPPPGQNYHHQGNYYTPPPYMPSPQFTGTTNASNDAYYAPPPGPPTGQAFEMLPHNRTGSPYNGSAPVPLSSHPTGTSTHSHVQSNNPFQSPASPQPVHVTDVHNTGKH